MRTEARSRIAVGVLFVALTLSGMACDRRPTPGEVEEQETSVDDVPAGVLTAARNVAERIGSGGCDIWFWDTEDQDWECTYVGLSRPAELDLSPDGRFSELELVYSLAEVESILPETAVYIHERCRDDPDVLIELSLRSEQHLDAIPELGDAWTQSEVVLEFQCPNGVDYEIDARDKGIYRLVDDKQDISTHDAVPRSPSSPPGVP